jgi:predicted permease
MLSLLWRSWKSWKREKGLALLAILALAIGIGSATAIFTVVNAVLLKPLPYTHGERWVALFAGDTHDPGHFAGLSFADLLAYQERMRVFDVFGWYPVWGDFNLTSPGQPRHIAGLEVSPSLIASTGTPPTAGRFFTASDGPNVALISHRLFTQLGQGIIGQPLALNGQSYIVLGAMPAWFRFPLDTVFNQNSQNDVWIPLKKPIDEEHMRSYASYVSYARLKPGITIAQAQAEAKRVAAEIQRQNHPADPTYTSALLGLEDGVVREIRPILLLLFGAAGLLLFITCANVAGLLVGRSVGRARETAIRVALGGGQPQLALQYFFESLWISLAAALGGVLASVLLVHLIVLLAADYIPRSDEISTNWTVALFALGLAFLTATLSALAPLWQAFRTQPNEVLSEGVRASVGARSRKFSQALVIAEIALAFTLISAGAILTWQLASLNRTWPGFDPDGLVTFQLTRSTDSAQNSVFADKLIDALKRLPRVSDAALVNQVPLAGCCMSTSLFPEARSTAVELHKPLSLMLVSPDYFKTMRIPLLAGRLLNAHDTNENLLPVIIDEAAAKRYWPGQSAVGQFARLTGQNGSQVQIAGVVGTVKNEGLGREPTPEIYLLQNVYQLQLMNFVVRSTLPPATLAPAIRHAVARVDPAQPIYSIRSMREIFSESLIFQRIESVVIAFFALAALLMASLGVYGLISYSVRQRTVEMGTRMALGSTGRQLLQLITRSGLRLSLYGLLIGALAVAGASGIVVRYFNVHHLTPIPYVFSIVAVIALALVASMIPAWRASLLSPMVAIRNETDSIWTSARRTLEQARQRISPEDTSSRGDSTLLTEFIEASRRADSFSDAIRLSLHNLVGKLHAGSALLLEKIAPGEFHCLAADPESRLATLSIPEEGFLLNRLRFYSAPLGFTSADLETSLRWASEQKPRHLQELELLKALDLRLAAPLRTKNDLIGLLLFSERTEHTPYSPSEKRLLAACAELFALSIENARLNERVLEQEKVRRDLALATEVQKRLLPENPPQTSVASLGAFTLAARNIGGDYYDFFQVGDHSLAIALADVAGKGIAAALIMAVVQASLRIIASDGNVSLPELAARMNHFLHRSTGFNSYATFFYAQLDEAKRQLRYVNAGHNPPYLVRALPADPQPNGASALIEELSAGGMIIGMFPFATYEEAAINLHPGDVLMAFTDGVTEALNPAEEEFGEDRLKELIRRVAHLPVTGITSAISRELRDWISTAPQHDDLTFLILKLNASE